MKKILFLLILIPIFLVGCKITTTPTDQSQPIDQNQASLANPASVYCEQQGGKLEIRSDAEDGQIGVCMFADDSECEEWSYFRGECQPQSQTEDISNEIKQLFIQKYNKNQDEVKVTVNQQTTNYARGGVKFGQNGIGEGGIFLATKINDKWQLVFDGNGMILCSKLKDYNFPETMTTDCFDY